MADIKYVTLENLTRYDSNFKTYVNSEKTNSLKALTVKDNSISFYTNPNPDDATIADFTVDLPTEMFLDQTKTTFVQSFIWNDIQYPNSTNPNLEGKPVLVLAVKGDDEVTYSFLNMEALIDIYTGQNTKSVKITVSADNKISADVQISAADGNILSIKDDGLYASVTSVDISGKADKLVNPEEGDAIIKENQILVDNGNGNIAASGKTIAEVTNEILASFSKITDEEIDALFE